MVFGMVTNQKTPRPMTASTTRTVSSFFMTSSLHYPIMTGFPEGRPSQAGGGKARGRTFARPPHDNCAGTLVVRGAIGLVATAAIGLHGLETGGEGGGVGGT